MGAWIDISRRLSPATPPWPGDVPFSQTWTQRTDHGDSVNCSAFRQSAHVGTHADAPRHVTANGATTDAWGLSPFMGPADVVVVPPDTRYVTPEHLHKTTTPRILLKTECSSRPSAQWTASFPALSVDAVQWMQNHDVVLMGTDAPSVDPANSTTLDAHHALNNAGIVNLENLRLGSVVAGTYTLIALPMPLAQSDAAPVRAVLHPAADLLNASTL